VSVCGHSEGGHHREFGRADIEVKAASQLFDSTWSMGERHPVWMSHGDRITRMPPGFEVAAVSPNAPFAIIQDQKRKYYGLTFHPEVVHGAPGNDQRSTQAPIELGRDTGDQPARGLVIGGSLIIIVDREPAQVHPLDGWLRVDGWRIA